MVLPKEYSEVAECCSIELDGLWIFVKYPSDNRPGMRFSRAWEWKSTAEKCACQTLFCGVFEPKYLWAVELIKTTILQSQYNAIRLANQEQLKLYFGIGYIYIREFPLRLLGHLRTGTCQRPMFFWMNVVCPRPFLWYWKIRTHILKGIYITKVFIIN